MMMFVPSPGEVGGFLLILGAFALYKGKAFYSIILYFAADLMWVFLAIETNDIVGAILIGIGMAFGLGVFYKMNTGIFIKDLHA